MRKRLLSTAIFLLMAMISFGQITSVGLIGSATEGGWDYDTNMVQDPVDTSLWTLSIYLKKGEVKFRANDAWDINWGSADFPSGIGEQGGPNIPIPGGGLFDITFNSVSGEYAFVLNSPIGIIGSATDKGWDEDIDMFKDTSENGFFVDIQLSVGDAKFRKDNAWDVNWGSADFPSGIGTQGGPNIPVSKAGLYHVTLDTMTGAYNFGEVVKYTSISLIGDAVGGWDTDVDLTQDANDPDLWSGDVQLADGEFKFRADHAWDTDWGGGAFPKDTAVAGGGNITAVAGNYRVFFNTKTLIYNFLVLQEYDTMGLIGSATPGGWDTDTDMQKDPNDGNIWHLTTELTDGEAKFRANHKWDDNWGGADFPAGIATKNGANIPVTAGRYNITFNSLTGEYNFEAFVVYDQISLVGKDGPFGRWPDDTPDYDTYLTVDPNDDQVWTGKEIKLTEADTATSDSGIKFRANTDWKVNWGSRDFPSGTGTQDGPNIWCKEGKWDVTLNTQSGEYLFVLSDAVKDVIKPSDIAVFPNPASRLMRIDLSKLELGNSPLRLQFYSLDGTLVKAEKIRSSGQHIFDIDLSILHPGMYEMHISSPVINATRMITIMK